jgi:1,4-alpha-glucan branching enzyme
LKDADVNATRQPVLGDLDAYLLGEGNHFRLYDVMGAHVRTFDGVSGTAFALWAPNARRVSVVGDFNDWDGNRHRMWLRREIGVWELFVPGVAAGARYKYELEDNAGHLLPLRVDPIGFYAEQRPRNASIVWDAPPFGWTDAAWLAERGSRQHRDAAISIYEVHLGSWARKPEEDNRFLTYRELAEKLVPYVRDLGFTHIELLPITEHPFDGSWGYQTTGWFAPTSRFGTPDDARAFVDAAHAAGLGVIVDWVPGHFPTDDFSLGRFDGTSLYEHADPRKGFHKEWGTFAFNLGRTEVANILLASALYWLREFHIDGLRVDAVSSIIYLDYDREAGAWIPNIHGGNENLDSTAFLRRFNTVVYGEFPDVMTIAEESTAYAGVTTPVSHGGLGFGFKWNMGWMHDTLKFMARDPMYRSHHLNEISFGLIYAFTENFVLPLSHDEVVHGKGSLFGKMPGSDYQKFANLRLLFGHMFGHPGKKMIFAGGEFAQRDEWKDEASLDWHLTQWLPHSGMQRLIGDCNRLYRELPALHERDAAADGFEWIQYEDVRDAVYAWVRWDAPRANHVVVVCNFSGARLDGYRIGVPQAGTYRELLNTDAGIYGGGNEGNAGAVHTDPVRMHRREHSLVLTLPPLAALIFAP